MNRWYCRSLPTAIFKNIIWGNKFDATFQAVAITHSGGEIQRLNRGGNTPGAGRTLSLDILNVMLKWQEMEMIPGFIYNSYNKHKYSSQKKICELNL